MKIVHSRVFSGANAWTHEPVLQIELELGLSGKEKNLSPQVRAFTAAWLPTEAEGERMDWELDAARALANCVRKLQQDAAANVPEGMPSLKVPFAAARRGPGERILAAVSFAWEPVAHAAVEIAWRLLTEGSSTQPSTDEIRRLHALDAAQRPPSTVGTTYFGARTLGVPVVKLNPEYNGYLILGQGARQRRVRWSEPDAISGVARLASTDKYLTNQLLASIGVPVPNGRLVENAAEGWAAAQEVGLPVAVKPYNCDQQTAVSLDLRSREKIEAACEAAFEHATWALVEHFAPGLEHRVVVVGERVVAVTRIDPPHVWGDGVSTIAQLVAKVNQEPRRNGEDAPLAQIKLDEVAHAVLAAQGYTVDSVPPAGQRVLARRDPPYFYNGGVLTDLTDVIHPTVAAHAVAAAKMMQVPVAGLDIVADDITRPLEEQGGIVVEINANPGLWLHLAPWADRPRPVGEKIVAWLFPKPAQSRIPVVAIVGDKDQAIQKKLTELLASDGLQVGSATATEMTAGTRRWPTPPRTPAERAYFLFRNPAVDVALFPIESDELVEHGFAGDRCDVIVLAASDLAPDAVRALSHAARPMGVFIGLPGWTPARLAVDCERCVRISETDDDQARSHLQAGGRIVMCSNQQISLAGNAGAPVILQDSCPASRAELQTTMFALAARHFLRFAPQEA